MADLNKFFTRVERVATGGLDDRKAEYLARVGPSAVAHMNPRAKHPCMQPEGSCAESGIYVLGGFPSAGDDASGEHFSYMGSGDVLTTLLPMDVRFNYVVQTRTPNGRYPTPGEIEAHRGVVTADIEEHKPRLIIAVGPVAIQWLLTKRFNNQYIARGRRCACMVGKHPVWVYTVLDPELFENAKERDYLNGVPAREYRKTLRTDINTALNGMKTWGEPQPMQVTELEANSIVCVDESNIDTALHALYRMSKCALTANDYETNCLRPFASDARILTFSVSDGDSTVGLAINHPLAPWSPGRARDIDNAMRMYLHSPNKKIAHNASMELEFSLHFYGKECEKDNWLCTQAQAYTLDPRRGALSLEYLCLQHFGLNVKASSPLTAKEHKLIDCDPSQVVRYNNIDSYSTYWLYDAQQELVKHRNLQGVYEMQNRRVATVTAMQAAGFPVQQEIVEKLVTKYEYKRDKAEKDIYELVRSFEQASGIKFDISTKKHWHQCFKWMGFDTVDSEGKESLSEPVLLATGSDLAEAELARRKAHKVLSTYLLPLDTRNPDTLVYPDGNVHCKFNTTYTITGRLSSCDPNMQNFPKRGNKEPRRPFTAPDGMVIIASDYGQIEARVICMASKDKMFTRFLWDGEDIHMYWATKLAEIHPESLETRGGDIKNLRGDIKNQLVFPLIYGAGKAKISRILGTPEDVTEELICQFWKGMEGCRSWQRKQVQFYDKKHYVRSLTGRRRYGPLTHNEILNTPIQATASDIVVDAMDRLKRGSTKLQMPHLLPRLNIHDDITFVVPESEKDAYIETIVKYMVHVPFSFVNVPISIEVECGRSWEALESVGVFNSEDKY